MNAAELYNLSLGNYAYGKGVKEQNTSGLPLRIYHALERIGLAQYYVVDKEALLKMVLSGEIWKLRNFGPASIKKVCEFLASQKGE